MFINNRVVLKDNTVKSDISAVLSDAYAGEKALAIVAAEDALYIGSDFPFNNRFLMLGKKNTVAGAIAIAVWDGSAFTAAEDIQDFTSVDGIPFARNGLIRFALPSSIGWGRVYDASDIPELSTLKSKANFWAKITFTADFDFSLKYVGFRFARDADLATYYRDLLQPNTMRAFNMGVPMENWDELHVVAAEEIIRDLRAEEIIYSGNSVLDPENFTDAACHKVAIMAFSQLKNDTRVELAQDLYRKAMGKGNFNVDKNRDGRLSVPEKTDTGRLRRV